MTTTATSPKTCAGSGLSGPHKAAAGASSHAEETKPDKKDQVQQNTFSLKNFFESSRFAEYWPLPSGALRVSWVPGCFLQNTANPFVPQVGDKEQPLAALSSDLRLLSHKKEAVVYLEEKRRGDGSQGAGLVHKAFLVSDAYEGGVEQQEVHFRQLLAVEECAHLRNLPRGVFPELRHAGWRNRGARRELWVAMECVGARTLFEQLAVAARPRSERWCSRQARLLSQDVLSALSLLSRDGWLFFDSKPSNWVLRAPDSERQTHARPVDAGSSLLMRVAKSKACPRDTLLLEWINVFYALVNLLLCKECLDERVAQPLCSALRGRLSVLEVARESEKMKARPWLGERPRKRRRRRRGAAGGQESTRAGARSATEGSSLVAAASALLGSLCEHAKDRKSSLFCPVDLLREYSSYYSQPFPDSWLGFFALARAEPRGPRRWLPQGAWSGVLDRAFCDCGTWRTGGLP